MQICKKCKAIIPVGQRACEKCGTAIGDGSSTTSIPQNNYINCNRCGAYMKPTDKFCMKCGASNIRNYTKVCLKCGLVFEESVKHCNKCGSFVETVKCPACGKPTNPLEVACHNCNSNIVELAKSDIDKSATIIQIMLKTESFKQIQANELMLRLANQNSIIGLAVVYAFEAAAIRAGDYNRVALFVYEETPPDQWDNPPTWYNPREQYSSKQEFIEAIRRDSKRPDMGFLAWLTIYAKTGKDRYAYQLCIMLSNIYTTLGYFFDSRGMIISECGVELQHQAYDLLCVAQNNPQINYLNDDVAKKLFSDVRYKLARQYFTIDYLGFSEPDEDGNYSGINKYYSNYKDGYKKALGILKGPRVEDQTQAKLLRGLLYYNFGDNKNFIDAWNIACNDADYINFEKDYMDDGIFALSAIFMSDIARQDGNIEFAMNILRFAYSHITRKHWAEVLQEEYSKYQ